MIYNPQFPPPLLSEGEGMKFPKQLGNGGRIFKKISGETQNGGEKTQTF